jgi:spore coat protein CotF
MHFAGSVAGYAISHNNRKGQVKSILYKSLTDYIVNIKELLQYSVVRVRRAK